MSKESVNHEQRVTTDQASLTISPMYAAGYAAGVASVEVALRRKLNPPLLAVCGATLPVEAEDDEDEISCERPAGHKGAHLATLRWGPSNG